MLCSDVLKIMPSHSTKYARYYACFLPIPIYTMIAGRVRDDLTLSCIRAQNCLGGRLLVCYLLPPLSSTVVSRAPATHLSIPPFYRSSSCSAASRIDLLPRGYVRVRIRMHTYIRAYTSLACRHTIISQRTPIMPALTPIMPALCSQSTRAYYARNYAGILGACLSMAQLASWLVSTCHTRGVKSSLSPMVTCVHGQM